MQAIPFPSSSSFFFLVLDFLFLEQFEVHSKIEQSFFIASGYTHTQPFSASRTGGAHLNQMQWVRILVIAKAKTSMATT
jgi:hypothetical protein